ncbi:MAG: arginine decarboxylase [Parcubacteria bacterium C7867-001]|nr:MAG: arginine decarboxylase [Parcubacteria bacterium C7867-001]
MKKRVAKRSSAKSDPKKFWKLGVDDFNTEHFSVNAEGQLIVHEGKHQYNILDVIKKYGTSTEIVFPTIIENRVRDIISTFDAYIKILGYKGKYRYHYPMKVNQNKEFVLPAVNVGANVDVSSSNELYIVKRMLEQGVFRKNIHIICNGPKTPSYMDLVEELRAKNLNIVPIIEDYVELERMKKFNGPVGIRVNLDVKVKSHWDKKFNRFGFTEAELLKIGKVRNLSILHYHISSQVETLEGFAAPLKRAIDLYAKMREKNPGLDTIDIGGGAAIPYEKKRLYSTKTLIQRIVRTAKTHADKIGVKHPNLVSEWGRYVAAPAQITLYRIMTEKALGPKDDRRWYVIDGSFMNDLLDTWAIHQKWHVIPVNALNAKKLRRVWLAGSSCDSDDKYTAGGTHILLPDLETNRELYIAVLDTGAYQDPLASHHCLLSSPAKLIAANGEIKIARKREQPEEVRKLFGW